MMPGLNPKMLAQAMKKMGIKQEEIPAIEVIIKTQDGKDLIIRNPQVSKVNAMGQESLQVIGDIEELSSVSKEDIDTVAQQAGVSAEKAKKALEENNNDLASAILSLKK
ncbi:MAG TPA: nascent polypeptide-associated complex protein [Candidatus Nanoarchaeia archaeon]|nr:nascent polypeptide-associated complex protein [Candidatus Nanoarchaeia archaeon]